MDMADIICIYLILIQFIKFKIKMINLFDNLRLSQMYGLYRIMGGSHNQFDLLYYSLFG